MWGLLYLNSYKSGHTKSTIMQECSNIQTNQARCYSQQNKSSNRLKRNGDGNGDWRNSFQVQQQNNGRTVLENNTRLIGFNAINGIGEGSQQEHYSLRWNAFLWHWSFEKDTFFNKMFLNCMLIHKEWQKSSHCSTESEMVIIAMVLCDCIICFCFVHKNCKWPLQIHCQSH